MNPGLERWQAQRRAERKAGEQRFAEAEAMEAAWRKANWREIEQARKLRQAALVRHHVAKRRVTKLQRTPAWADQEAIRAVYLEAQRLTRDTGIPHHVDHIVPLQGRLVSGLHVAANLQILTGSENSRKGNHFEVEA